MFKLEMAGMMEAAAMRPPGALSIGRNLVMLPTAAINPAIPLIGAGASAAADKMYQLSAQGKSAQEALARGAVSGGIEAVTEYLPLHSLMDLIKVGGTSAAMGILKQVGTEAGEEGVSYFLNYLADKAAKDPNAKFDWDEFWKSVGQGGLSGLFFGVAGTAAHTSADGVYEVSGDSDASIEGAGDKIIRSADDINYGQSSLDKAFSKHSTDFGTYPDGSNASKDLFKSDIDNLLETGLQKSGTYRATPGTHVYNPSTRQWAFYDANGNFVTAFKLGPDQFGYLIETGVVK